MSAPLDLNRVNRARRRGRLAAALFVCLASAFAFGVWLGHRVVSWDDLPDVRILEQHRPGVITRVFAADGSVIGEFAQERRILLAGPDVPEHLRQALEAVS